MHLTFREATKEDFDTWYGMTASSYGRSPEWRDGVWHEWSTFFASGVQITLVVEDSERAFARRGVAFGSGVFVTNRFVRWLREGQVPYVLVHATHPLPDGSWPLRSVTDLELQNSSDGLNLLINRWSWDEEELSMEESLRVRTFMNEQFSWLHGGYQLKEILTEGMGESYFNRAVQAGFTLINDYADYYVRHPPLPPDSHRPYLFGITRQEAKEQEGCALTRAFLYTQPRFFFTAHEREFLCQARLGSSDEKISQTLCLSTGTVKKRWGEIYARVNAVDGDFLPPASEHGRGREKRQILVDYVRDHPEELRSAQRQKASDVTGSRLTLS